VSIAIVGAGIIGLSVAWRLSQAGRRVTVFDKGYSGKEASWAGAGMLSPGGEVDEASEFGRLLVESRSLYREFVGELRHESGLPIDYQECGALELAYSAAEMEAIDARAAAQAKLGINSKAVPAADVRAFWPRVRADALTGARFYPADAIVNSRDLVAALQAACTNRGVALREQAPVRKLTVRGENTLVQSQREESFDSVVVAAGAWSSGLVVEGVPPLPLVEPVKGHLIGYQQPPQTCDTIVRHGHNYLLQRANGMLIAGASVEHSGFDRAIQPDLVKSLAERAAFVLPHLADTTPTDVWIGFRPGSDRVRIEPWHSQRLHLAYGHFRNGILLAPVTADRIVAMLAPAS
jgi:glycine oxidase